MPAFTFIKQMARSRGYKARERNNKKGKRAAETRRCPTKYGGGQASARCGSQPCLGCPVAWSKSRRPLNGVDIPKGNPVSCWRGFVLCRLGWAKPKLVVANIGSSDHDNSSLGRRQGSRVEQTPSRVPENVLQKIRAKEGIGCTSIEHNSY